MSTYDGLISSFTRELEAEITEILDEVGFEIFSNIKEKQANSGNSVNSLNLPADTTGATGASIKVQSEPNISGLDIALVGRKGIMNIDKGNPPAKETGEWGSFESFYQAIEAWARAKEQRYGFEGIDAEGVAWNVWRYGGVLYQAGGGTESIRDLLPPAAEKIDGKITEIMEKYATEMAETIIDFQE